MVQDLKDLDSKVEKGMIVGVIIIKENYIGDISVKKRKIISISDFPYYDYYISITSRYLEEQKNKNTDNVAICIKEESLKILLYVFDSNVVIVMS